MFNRGILKSTGKLVFLAGWGLALGACMNEANAQELAKAFIALI
ncbi:MAG TPA: hypothetical protein VIC26_05350 [Marinagarivorans sp.]